MKCTEKLCFLVHFMCYNFSMKKMIMLFVIMILCAESVYAEYSVENTPIPAMSYMMNALNTPSLRGTAVVLPDNKVDIYTRFVIPNQTTASMESAVISLPKTRFMKNLRLYNNG